MPPTPGAARSAACPEVYALWGDATSAGGHEQCWLPQPRTPAAVLGVDVAAGTLTEVKRRSGGRTMLDVLVRDGALNATRLPAAAAATWAPQMPMPHYWAQHLRAAPSVNAMLDGLTMPSDSDQAENNAFLARCMSLYLQHGRSAVAVPSVYAAAARRSVQRWRGGHPAASGPESVPPPEVELSDLPRQCMGCHDTLDIYSLKFRMPGCEHPAVFDRDCYIRGLESYGGHACPTPGCTSRLCADDLMAKGIEGAWVDTLPQRIVSTWQQSQPMWRGCPTEGCLNGRLLAPDSRHTLHCGCCGTHAILSTRPTLFNRLDENARQFVFLLITDAIRPRSDIIRPTCDVYRGLVRECYHCGAPTEQRGGCSHMKCKDCHHRWDFVTGDQKHHKEGRPGQMYVPHKSWLVELGLYHGLEPGHIYPAHVITQTLRTNLACIEEECAKNVDFEQTRIVHPATPR